MNQEFKFEDKNPKNSNQIEINKVKIILYKEKIVYGK